MLMGEFLTAVKYKLPVTVVIIKNNTLGQIKSKGQPDGRKLALMIFRDKLSELC